VSQHNQTAEARRSEARSKALPYTVHFATTKHPALCGKHGSDYTSSPHAHAVTCQRCRAVMKRRAHEAECEAAAMALLSERGA
jgi:hypothetical protein